MFSQLGSIFGEMLILFIVLGVGFIAKTIGLMDVDFDQKLSRLVLNVTLPAFVIASVLNCDTLPERGTLVSTLGFAAISYMIIVALGLIAPRVMHVQQNRFGVYAFMLIFGNVGFIGFPILSALYGSQALIYGVINNLFFNILCFTLGIWLISNDGKALSTPVATQNNRSNTSHALAPKTREIKHNAHRTNAEATRNTSETLPGGRRSANDNQLRAFLKPEVLLSPCTVASLITLFFAFVGIHQLPLITEAVDTVGSITVPLAMLIVGSSLADTTFDTIFSDKRFLFMVAQRLLIAPLIVWAVLGFFCNDKLILGVIVMLSGMPIAINGCMFCNEYGADNKTMAQGIFVTTLAAFLSIPLWGMLLAV